ncbi:hypothetical protein ACJX0J_011075, partial [Zea mays]
VAVVHVVVYITWGFYTIFFSIMKLSKGPTAIGPIAHCAVHKHTHNVIQHTFIMFYPHFLTPSGAWDLEKLILIGILMPIASWQPQGPLLE